MGGGHLAPGVPLCFPRPAWRRGRGAGPSPSYTFGRIFKEDIHHDLRDLQGRCTSRSPGSSRKMYIMLYSIFPKIHVVFTAIHVIFTAISVIFTAIYVFLTATC